MDARSIRKLIEILNRAKEMRTSLPKEAGKVMPVQRVVTLISAFNEAIRADDPVLAPVDPLRSWDGATGKGVFAYVEDVTGALSEIIGALESLPELKLSQETRASDILNLINLARTKLRRVIRERPENEKQVQNAFETLLIGANIPYSRETDSIEYSSKTYVPDFSLPSFDLALEIKFCSNEEREKRVIPEINDDIVAYRTKYRNAIFIVYDLGFIRDVERFRSSFELSPNVFVEVVKQ